MYPSAALHDRSRFGFQLLHCGVGRGRHGFSEMVFGSPIEPVVFGCFPCCSSRMYRFTRAGTITRSMKPCTSGLTFLAAPALGLL